MTVVPLARLAAISTLSVPVWLGYSSTTRFPTSRGSRGHRRLDPALHVAVGRGEHRSHRGEGVEVHVDGPGAEVVAAGQGHLGPAVSGQQWAEDHHRGPHLLHQLVGGLGHHVGRGGHHQFVGGAPAAHVDTHGPEHLPHDVDVGDPGDVGEHVATLGQQAGRHQLQDRVLGPTGPDRPRQRAVGGDDEPVHATSMAAAGPLTGRYRRRGAVRAREPPGPAGRPTSRPTRDGSTPSPATIVIP